jgi:hypothetical protein
MSTTPRATIASFLRQQKPFKLRIPGAGITVETKYDFNRHTLVCGDIVAVVSPNGAWVDIGQVMSTMPRDISGIARYLLCAIPRLDERMTFPELKIPANNITCLLEVLDE